MRLPFAAALVTAALVLGSCSDDPEFRIAAGDELRPLEPVIAGYCREHHVRCTFDYRGSVDLALMTSARQPPEVDAVWSASSLWLDLFDTGHRVSRLRVVARSPVILGVRTAKARALGWTAKAPTMDDIRAAIRDGRVRLMLPSATRANAGAAAYLALAASDDGTTDAAELGRLVLSMGRAGPTTQAAVDAFTGAAKGTAPYDGLWDAEADLASVNKVLREQGAETLWAVYPTDGAVWSDAALGFVDRDKDPKVRTFFDGLQAWLRSPRGQSALAEKGWRSGAAAPADASWNLDPARAVAAVRLPGRDQLLKALNAYQAGARPPVVTAVCVDASDGMTADTLRAVASTLRDALTPATAQLRLIAWTLQDRLLVIPFDTLPRAVFESDGTAASQARLTQQVAGVRPGGRADLFACTVRALEAMQPHLSADRRASVIVVSAGVSDSSPQYESRLTALGGAVPIYAVALKGADRAQLQSLASTTNGAVFTGTVGLEEALRAAQGYN